ncbi:MAG: helix-turn-helix transcriptional regulator [Clostridia bacterium]|nr:helix-turn-helix transcriptional regulator [Clostridia bacterium]
MEGINLNKTITFLYASLRYFSEGEKHVTRVCNEDVLLLVFDGILRFVEDDVEYEVYPGTYHIQKHGSRQRGIIPSDSPQYLYVHFLADWSDERRGTLPKQGTFDYQALKLLMEDIDTMSHGDYTICECSAKFFELLSRLYRKRAIPTMAGKIADYIEKNYIDGLTLEKLAEEFHFSKNHVINIFKQEYGMTPFEYINCLRVKKAEWMLEATSCTSETIALECGFNNYSHFFKVFRAITGISPTKWREKKRITPSCFISGEWR